ncbi:hypothetical protein BsWGS_28472 [Bradybaena similaris]
MSAAENALARLANVSFEQEQRRPGWQSLRLAAEVRSFGGVPVRVAPSSRESTRELLFQRPRGLKRPPAQLASCWPALRSSRVVRLTFTFLRKQDRGQCGPVPRWY